VGYICFGAWGKILVVLGVNFGIAWGLLVSLCEHYYRWSVGYNNGCAWGALFVVARGILVALRGVCYWRCVVQINGCARGKLEVLEGVNFVGTWVIFVAVRKVY
jgi:hypothetical protein